MKINKSVRDEIPDMAVGLNTYYNYCNKQIKENKLHIRRLYKRMEWCEEKAKKFNINLELMDQDYSENKDDT